MVKSYWFRILFCGIAAAILGFIVALVTPKQYDAELQVLVAPYSPTINSAQTDVDETVSDILRSASPRSVSTQVEMLTSMGVIQTAAAQVGNKMGLPYTSPGDELNPQQLQDKISISAARESDIVTLKVRMSSADLARQVAAAMYLAFEEENERQSRDSAERAIAFLNQQNQKIQSQLDAIESEQARARKNLGMPDVQTKVTALISQQKDYETQLAEARAQLAESEAQAADLKRQLALVPQKISGGSSTAENPDYAQYQGLLAKSEADKDAALQHYLPDSEQIQAYNRQIDGLKAKLASISRYAPSVKDSVTPNPAYQQLFGQYAMADATAKGAAKRVASLELEEDRLNAQMAGLPDVQMRLNDLDRQKAVLERISELYTSKLKTLEVAGVSHSSATHVWTNATAFNRPSVPNYSLNVGLGFFLGLAVGFLWSIGTEAKRNPIRSLGQLNRLSLQPCYRVIPELRNPMRGLNRAPADAFDSLLVNFVRSEKKGYRLGVLGVTRGAGSSTTAMNLAVAAARGGYSVLFVEVDPSNSGLSKLSASGDGKGTSSNISIYNASIGESAGSSGFSSDIDEAAQGKDLVIFDFSPVKVSGDAFLVANQMDEMLLLVRANVTKSVDFLQAQQALIDTGCPLVTVTLSRVQDQSDDVAALEQQTEIRSITPQA